MNKMESMSFEQLFPSLARSLASDAEKEHKQTDPADVEPTLVSDFAAMQVGRVTQSSQDNEDEADHNEDETDLAHVEPT